MLGTGGKFEGMWYDVVACFFFMVVNCVCVCLKFFFLKRCVRLKELVTFSYNNRHKRPPPIDIIEKKK